MNFYERIISACDSSGITITQLTQEIGVSKSNIRNWKDGVIPKFSVRLKIAKITNRPIEDFLTTDEIEIYKTVKSG